jgi:hypothetical protein
MSLSDSQVREIQKALEGVDYHYGEVAIRKVADAVLEIAAREVVVDLNAQGYPGSARVAAKVVRRLKGGGE